MPCQGVSMMSPLGPSLSNYFQVTMNSLAYPNVQWTSSHPNIKDMCTTLLLFSKIHKTLKNSQLTSIADIQTPFSIKKTEE